MSTERMNSNSLGMCMLYILESLMMKVHGVVDTQTRRARATVLPRRPQRWPSDRSWPSLNKAYY
jgi:hypothetical protein